MAKLDPLLVPIQLDAFVLNPAVCGTPEENDARICPITQPNYTFLRFTDAVAQSDVMPNADLHNATPAARNPRMTDLGTGLERRNRWGVYLHWVLPRVYRTGMATETREEEEEESQKEGETKDEEETREEKEGEEETPQQEQPSQASPPAKCFNPPTRWVVIRKLDLDSMRPSTVRDEFSEYEAWVVESDHVWHLDDIPLEADLQVDMSPFVLGASGDQVNVAEQAEIFIGRKTRLSEWPRAAPARTTIPGGLNLQGSGNPLFADFQLHNPNVFSIVDNFQYGSGKTTSYLQAARASYYVIGWHKDAASDPLAVVGDKRTRQERLQSIFMTLEHGGKPNGKEDDKVRQWLESTESTRLVCHGAMYNVDWDESSKPTTVPADKFAQRLRNPQIPTVAVGTTPLDSLITYLAALKPEEGDSDAVGKVEESILALQSLLYGQEEDLNQHQDLLEALERECEQRRWDMFSAWWKHATDSSSQRDYENLGSTRKATERLAETIEKLDKESQRLRKRIMDMKTAFRSGRDSSRGLKMGAQPFYYRARDPTVLVGGIGPGWPEDYFDPLRTRLEMDIIRTPQTPSGDEQLKNIRDGITTAFRNTTHEEMAEAFQLLLDEFEALNPVKPDVEITQMLEKGETERRPSATVEPPQPEPRYPQYHIRDVWNGQPWRPLYLEWEVEYWHVPFDLWSLEERAARLSDNRQVRYSIDGSMTLWNEMEKNRKPSPSKKDTLMNDTRIISGRVLILPQPGFSLQVRLQQLFANTPKSVLDGMLPEEDRQKLMASVSRLPFLSAPLSGLTENLLTMSQGAHIKPENQETTEKGKDVFTVIDKANFDDAGLTRKNLALIQGHSGLTPFAGKYSFLDSPYHPFKPMTHGQFRFRKLNIIDKFGQTLVAIDPSPSDTGFDPIYPCISDFFEPGTIEREENGLKANTVVEDDPGLCQFVQLPPQINQNARLNAEFVIPSEKEANWTPAAAWDNPVWGWIVANYANHAIQFFLGDGTFYQEVRIGGPDGALMQPKWGPTPADPIVTASPQFDLLIQSLSGKPDHLKEFWTMITEALRCLGGSPESYASALPAMIGRPLALVNMGWSLELDRRWPENQSTQVNRNLRGAQAADYSLPVKLGDAERRYDGLMGYFTMPDEGVQNLNLNKCFTHFVPAGSSPSFLHAINRADYPTFTPVWTNPWNADQKRWLTPAEYEVERNRHLKIFGAILDPFAPVKGYSSFLPPKSLQLPAWVAEQAMHRMTAFFHVGPVVLTEPPELNGKYPGETGTRPVALPGLGKADEWQWWQPYEYESDEATREGDQGAEGDGEIGNVGSAGNAGSAAASVVDILPQYTRYDINHKTMLEHPGFQPGPYIAIEGFLQMKRPDKAEENKS